MPEPDLNPNGASNDATKISLNESNTATVELELDESKAHLINGGAGGDHDELKTRIVDPASVSDGELSFNGLGKEEVMRYANDPFWVRLRWILFILFWVGWLAMLVTAVVIIVLAPRCPPRPDLKWYQTETVYQVFPKSFKDSNGDGIGDFGGLTEKLSYITDLGIKAIWINSIFVSDDKSSLGVVDHKDINPSFGVSLDEFKGWLKKLRKEGLKVILDLIPNQTSKNHIWFQKSKQNDDQYKSYYIWADGLGNGPPNEWKTQDGEPAWTYDNDRGSWYFHQFSSDYPDLNLTNGLVKDEFKEIMKFWIDAGVSGFNIEGVEYLVENDNFSVPDDVDRSQTRNYVGTLSFLEELREVANTFSDKPGREKLLFGTVKYANDNQTLELWGNGEKKRLHIVAPLLKDLVASCGADCIKLKVDELLTDDQNQWLGLELGNQYVSRIATRLNQYDDYKLRLVIAYALQLLLPGTPFNYYGDEFGQRDGDASLGSPHKYQTPMQWNSQENAGFTSKDGKPWLSVGTGYKNDTVQASLAVFSGFTPFKAFKSLVTLRKRESFQWGKTQLCTPHPDLLLFTRKATRFPYFLTVVNTGKSSIHVSPEELKCLPGKDKGKVVFHSQALDVGESHEFSNNGLVLSGVDVVVIEFEAEE